MMKSTATALLIIISVLLIAGLSNGRLLLKNKMFIFPNNPSAFDPNLSSPVDDESALHTANDHVEKDAVECDQERGSSAKSATNENKVSFRLSPSVRKTKKIESSALNNVNGVLNLLPKGAVLLSESSPNVNSMMTQQRLATSGNSPGVGHMQMIRPKSQKINVGIPKSHHSHGDDYAQQEKRNKHKLGSTPSPGGGH